MGRDLYFIGASLFMWGLGEGAFFSFQPIYLESMGAKPIYIGLILGGFGVAGLFTHLPAGYIADRFGRKPILILAWLAGLIATILMYIAHSLPFYVVAMYLYGATTFVVAPLNSYVSTAAGKLSVARALTLVSAAFNLGYMIGPVLGGVIGDRFGLRHIFPFSALIFSFSVMLIFFVRPQPIVHLPDSPKARTLLGNKPYMLFLGIYFIAILAMYLPQPLAPNFLKNQHGMEFSSIGKLYSINGLGIVISTLILGHFFAPIGFLIGQLSVFLFTLLIWQGDSFFVFGLAFFLMGGFRAARSMGNAHIYSYIDGSNMGIAFGMAETVNALAMILAPIIAGVLYGINPPILFSTSAATLILVMGVTTFFSFKRTHKLSPETIKPEN